MKKFNTVLIFSLLLLSCGSSSSRQKSDASDTYDTPDTDYEICTVGEPIEVAIDTTMTVVPEEPQVAEEPQIAEKPQVAEKAKPQKNISRLSKEYYEGYDKGYDDGEDDASFRNGYRGQFDDSSNYTGKKLKDFQLGYLDGYEAGYDDTMSDDGSDEAYE